MPDEIEKQIEEAQLRIAVPQKASTLAIAGYIVVAAVFGVIVWRKYIRQ